MVPTGRCDCGLLKPGRPRVCTVCRALRPEQQVDTGQSTGVSSHLRGLLTRRPSDVPTCTCTRALAHTHNTEGHQGLHSQRGGRCSLFSYVEHKTERMLYIYVSAQHTQMHQASKFSDGFSHLYFHRAKSRTMGSLSNLSSVYISLIWNPCGRL